MTKRITSIFLLFMIFLFSLGINVLADSNQPKVSIIIPVYNVEPYLQECMDSIVNQTLKDIEIICIDDCSTDNSFNILNEYAKSDNRIKLIKQTKNQGAYVARNLGLKIATGEYIGFVDPDDYIEPNTYEMSYVRAKKDNADIVVFGGESFSDNFVKPIDSIDASFKNQKCFKEYSKALLVIWNKIYKRDMLLDNNIWFREERYGMDTVFCFKVFPFAKNISFLSNKLYHWRKQVGNSASSTTWSNINTHTQKKLDQLQYFLDDWRSSGFIKDNEVDLLRWATWRLYDLLVNKLDPDLKCSYCKRFFDILGNDVYSEKTLKQLPNYLQKKVQAIQNYTVV
ncbi:MAG: Undecaprenyl-phosphate 4-deoxy-4-formamido-L-arabinose transferase [Eubacteriales bacterium SKADARSKE-1]|nr:Undecaprenyl-phosphate 4-deoxy-4-formamido-L-arabinose transferase [Eubacteriales bacterium SKADARSKE-1]